MRNKRILVLGIVLLLALTGCGKKEPAGKTYNTSTGVGDIMRAAESESKAAAEKTSEPESKAASEKTSESENVPSFGKTTQSEGILDFEDSTEPEGMPDFEDSTEPEGMLDFEDSTELENTVSSGEGTDSANAPSSDGVDLDLTQLSSTMVYSEVFAMMMAPEDYVGKTIKMEGLYNFYHDAMVNKDYHACVVQDATACCAQGIDFVLADGYDNLENYPEIDEVITVTGVFDLYDEGEYTFMRLKDAVLEY